MNHPIIITAGYRYVLFKLLLSSKIRVWKYAIGLMKLMSAYVHSNLIF